MNTKDILKKVRKIEIKTKRLSDHIFSGEYHSHFKGRGMTFSEVRPYAYGDEIRNIDWNVTARYRTPFVKVFEEERELTVMLAVDLSGTEFFGTKNQLKREMITEMAATLAFSAIQNNDKVGLMIFTDQIELFVPPKKGRSHVLHIIRQLLDFKPSRKTTDVSMAMKSLFNMLKKRSIIFFISDFMDTAYADTLKIVSQKHDVIGIRIYDPAEKFLPDMGFVRMYDPETEEEVWVDTSDRKIHQAASRYFQSASRYFKDSFNKTGSGSMEISTDESYVKVLMNFFKTRA